MLLSVAKMGQPDDITTAPSMAEKPITGDHISPACDVNGHSDEDLEKRARPQLPDLKRKLKSRHLQMIAIGMLPFPNLLNFHS